MLLNNGKLQEKVLPSSLMFLLICFGITLWAFKCRLGLGGPPVLFWLVLCGAPSWGSGAEIGIRVLFGEGIP